MKKWISAAVAAAMVVALAGCGSSGSSESTTEAGADTDAITAVEMNASDYFELGEYKGLTVEIETADEVTDEDVDEEVEWLAEDYAEFKEVTDRDTVEDEDYVTFDYTCTIDGEVSEDYSEEEVETQIGDEEYSIDDVYDLDEEMIGKKVGETFTLEYTFPEDYEDDTVAGKDCSMEVTISLIEVEDIPELTDEFIKENTDCDTLEEYREEIRTELETDNEDEVREDAEADLWEAITDNCKQLKGFEDDLLDQEMNNLLLENEEWASYFEMETQEFIEEYYGMTLEEYAEENLKYECILDLLVEAEDITVTDEEYDEEIALFISDYGYEDEEEIMEYYTEDEIRSDILYTKLMDTLMDYTNLVEVEAED